MLGELARQQQTHCRLDFAARYRRTPVVVSKTRRLGSNALKDVVDKAVHDRHGLAADARVRVDLLEHLVDVDGVALPSSPLSLLVAGSYGFRLAGGLLRSLASWLRWHLFFPCVEEKVCVSAFTASRLYMRRASIERSRDEIECLRY